MFATATQIDGALALAIGDAASCDWQDGPHAPVCAERAVWIAVMSCGCQHLCCATHRAAAELEASLAPIAILKSLALGQPAIAVCIGCHRPIFDFTIVWEPI